MHVSGSGLRRHAARQRVGDECLRLGDDLLQVLGTKKAFGVDLVPVLLAGGARKPATFSRHAASPKTSTLLPDARVRMLSIASTASRVDWHLPGSSGERAKAQRSLKHGRQKR
jgi:hypothetical protein